MASYDLKRLEVAIQYIRRMSDGKNPVTNRPAPENEEAAEPSAWSRSVPPNSLSP